MKKYRIVRTAKTMDYKFIEEYYYSQDGCEIFSEEDCIFFMNLLFDGSNSNITYVDSDYIEDEISMENNIDWYKGEGYYTINTRKKIIFNPLQDVVEEECHGKRYFYRAELICE